MYVYHFLALGFIDVDILQERTKKKVVRKGDGWVLKAHFGKLVALGHVKMQAEGKES